jgi:signal transduction histidine kinase
VNPWRTASAAVAGVVTVAAVVLPAVEVARPAGVAEAVCGFVVLACGLVVRGRRADTVAVLLLATAVAWSLPALAVTPWVALDRVLASFALVHVSTAAAAVVVLLPPARGFPFNAVALGMAVAAGASGAVGGYRVMLPLAGVALVVASLRGRGAVRAAGLVWGLDLVGAAIVRAAGTGNEDVLFTVHTLALCTTAMLVVLAARSDRDEAAAMPLGDVGLADLETTLADALAEPGLALAFPDHDGTWLDPLGRPRAPLPGDVLLVEDGGEVAAAVGGLRRPVPPSLHATLRLVRDNARLRRSLSTQVDDLAQSQRRLLTAGDAERAALERQLRAGAALNVDAILQRARGWDELANVCQRALTTRQALTEVASGLDPLAGHDTLGEALDHLAAGAPVGVTVSCAADPGDDAVRRTVWFTCSEAIANTAKYAPAAQVRIEVSVSGEPGTHDRTLEVLVTDDGPGGADPTGGGLVGLADRAHAVGGSLAVTSPWGSGTRIQVQLPLRTPMDASR